jgi:transcriptional regulator with XRE-family HTH domain
MRKRKKPRGKRLTSAQAAAAMQFAKALRREMKLLNLSPGDLARATGMQPETIRAYLRGTIRPSKRSLARLCMIVGQKVATAFNQQNLSGSSIKTLEILPLSVDRVMFRMELVIPTQLAHRILVMCRDAGVIKEAPAPGQPGQLFIYELTAPFDQFMATAAPLLNPADKPLG